MTVAREMLLAPADTALRVVPTRVRRLGAEFAGYVLVSGTALAVDVAIYWSLLKVIGIAAVAAAGGYVFGVVTHYVLSSRVVFARRLGARGLSAEAPVLAKFFVAGAVGLGITVAMVGLLADVLHVNALIAKLVATNLSFVSVFLALRAVVFNAPAQGRD